MLPLVAASVAVYAAAAALLLAAAHRWVRPLRRRVGLLIALLPLLFTGRATLTGGAYAPVDILYHDEPFASRRFEHGITRVQTPLLSDVVSQMLPWQKAVREAVTEGRFPVWNRFVLAGEPLLAVQQPAAVHPVTWLGLLLPLAQGWTLQMSLRLLIALLSAYLFLRDLGCADPPAILGAAAWGFSDFLVFYLGYPLANSVGPFPLLLLGLGRLAAAPDRRAVLLTTAALFLIATAGHPETLLFSVAGAGVYFLFALAGADPALRKRAVLASLAAGAAALGLAAVQLLPMAELLPHTWEHHFRTHVYAHADKSSSLVENGRRALPLLVPYAYGSSGHGDLYRDLSLPAIYAGSILFPLAITGVFSRDRRRWGLLALGALGIALWMRLPGITDALGKLPLFDIGILDYFVFLAALALSALAALGAERLSRGSGALAFLTGAALSALGILAVFRFRRFGMGALLMPEDYVSGRLFWQLAPLILGALLVACTRRPTRAGWSVSVLLGLLLAQRVVEAGSVYPTFAAAAFYPRLPLIERIRRDAPERFVGVKDTLVPNSSALYELEDVRGYESMTLHAFYETFPLWCVAQPVWFNRVDSLDRPFLSFLNVRWAMAPKAYPAAPGWTRIAEDGGVVLLENERVLPRAFVPGAIAYEPDAPRRLEKLALISDYSTWGVVDSPPPATGALEKNGAGRVTVVSYLEQAMTLDVEAEQDCVVGTSVTAWPGWKARLDGRAISPLSYNHAFLGFRAPKGRHRIELSYSPDGFATGGAISLVTLASLVWLGRRRRVLPDNPRVESRSSVSP